MRHFSLLRLLTFSSFTSSDGFQSGGPNIAATTHFGRGHRLHQSIQAAATSAETEATVLQSRRRALHSMLGGSIAFVAASGKATSPFANALDMDAFVNAQVRVR